MLKHMEENMDTAKSNRMIIMIWTLCPVIFIVYNLLTGCIVIRRDFFSICGALFFWARFLVIAMLLASVVVNVVTLRRRAKAAGNVPLKKIMGKSDIVHLVLPIVFGVLAFLILCFFI